MVKRHMAGPESSDGWVSWSDYQSLQAALDEALERWEAAEFHDRYTGNERIEALRRKFLDI